MNIFQNSSHVVTSPVQSRRLQTSLIPCLNKQMDTFLLQLCFALIQCQKASVHFFFFLSARMITVPPRYYNHSPIPSRFDLKNTFFSPLHSLIHFSILQHITWLSRLFISFEVRHGSFNQVNSQPHSAGPLQWLLNCQEPAKLKYRILISVFPTNIFITEFIITDHSVLFCISLEILFCRCNSYKWNIESTTLKATISNISFFLRRVLGS